MIDGHKHRDLALTGEGRGQVGAPHRVYRRRDDGAVVGARASGCPDPGGREQVVRAHEPQHATLGCAKACHAQPGPDLAVTLTVKGAGGQNRADRVHQGRIRHRPNRARTPGRFGPRGGEMPIDAGPRRTPDPAHAGQAIGLAAGGRDGPAHGRDLRRAKGRWASRAAILASSNSRSSSISPSFAFRRSVSSASPLVDRVTRLASPAETKVSCHPVRVAAVTPSARESISRSSPRNRRRTASRLRWRDMRPPRPKPTVPEAAVSVVIVTLLRITSAYRVSQRTGERSMGELIQIDGCEHHWFEDRGPPCTRLVFVDDATSRLMALGFVPSESTFAYFEVLRRYLEAHGKPVAFYSDKHSIFRVSKEDAAGGDGMTQFGRALADLNIEILCANSSQAKGRVERAHATLQDQLVKELRLAGISDREAANAVLPGFLESYNS